MDAVLVFLKQLDKLLHMLVCFGLTLMLALVLPIHYAMLIVMVIGAAKELYDYRHPATHTADVLDFLADGIGVAAAAALVIYVR